MGFGVYIWNVTQTTEVVAMLKKLRPDITIILGGPEVSYETEQQEIVALADHVITGEADVKFAEVCRRLLNDETRRGERSEAMANDERRMSRGFMGRDGNAKMSAGFRSCWVWPRKGAL